MDRKQLIFAFVVLCLAILACGGDTAVTAVTAQPSLRVIEVRVEATAPPLIAPATLLPAATPVTQPAVPDGDLAAVTRIIDGDTIEVTLDGVSYRVRYIGMDTPERGDFFFSEATEANRQLVEGALVILVKDVSETDRYGRLLRYVYLADGTFVNAELVRQGYAVGATFPPDVRHQALFLALEREARAAGRGLWAQPFDGDPDPAGSPPTKLPEPMDTRRPDSGTPPAAPPGCDPAYPTVCIPSPPPDLDCRDVPYRDFMVLSPDPHRFDGDHDGVGGES